MGEGGGCWACDVRFCIWLGRGGFSGEGAKQCHGIRVSEKSVPKKRVFIKRKPRNSNLGVQGVSKSNKCIIRKL